MWTWKGEEGLARCPYHYISLIIFSIMVHETKGERGTKIEMDFNKGGSPLMKRAFTTRTTRFSLTVDERNYAPLWGCLGLTEQIKARFPPAPPNNQ